MRNILLLAAIIFAIVSCSKDDDSLSQFEDTIIKTGTVCGWCGGNDSLTLTIENQFYKRVSPCDDSSFTKEETMVEKDFESLLEKLDISDFKAIDLNTCNSCADGCDTWISIQSKDDKHYIRYGSQDSMIIETIQPFLDAVNDWRLSLRN
ncbi:hypothetical protein [Membranihabitans marinus]|uniref:hypothetical protein n=1 Tax=Membranihabitans marinus TaxID=1227546 RepID=UPI001F22BD34|nr:hypothetical protein [Membranihabitans marinus]